MKILVTDTGEFCEMVQIDPDTGVDHAQTFLAQSGLLAQYFVYDALRAVWLCLDAVVDVCCEDFVGFVKI
ncbi:hypothetical protein OZK63_39085 [Streptomyces sp. UMAF16]|nr:hypothetical protein [Streptomyces sp. UMAF16]